VILALETSTATPSSAVVDRSGVVRGESRHDADQRQARRQHEGVHAALAQAGASLDDMDAVVCGLGPGTFTGLRIGVATARALAQAAGLEVGGVPTLEALARGLAAGEAGASATVFVPLIDGRRNEVFAAVYQRTARSPGAHEDSPEVGLAAVAHGPDTGPVAGAWPELEPALPLAVVRADEL
jgi:tRNA threonylcarbamoyladenosine biosynthesis protein TsaB